MSCVLHLPLVRGSQHFGERQKFDITPDRQVGQSCHGEHGCIRIRRPRSQAIPSLVQSL